MKYLLWVSTVKQVIMQHEFNTNHRENMSEVKEYVHHQTQTILKTAFIINKKLELQMETKLP